VYLGGPVVCANRFLEGQSTACRRGPGHRWLAIDIADNNFSRAHKTGVAPQNSLSQQGLQLRYRCWEKIPAKQRRAGAASNQASIAMVRKRLPRLRDILRRNRSPGKQSRAKFTGFCGQCDLVVRNAVGSGLFGFMAMGYCYYNAAHCIWLRIFLRTKR